MSLAQSISPHIGWIGRGKEMVTQDKGHFNKLKIKISALSTAIDSFFRNV